MLWGQDDVPEQLNLQARLDPLMNRVRDVSRPQIISKCVIDFQQFVTKPRAIKRQLPLKSRRLSASPDLNRPCVLRLKRCVNNTGIRTLIKIDHVVERRRLPTATEIHKSLRVWIHLKNRAELRIESPKVLPM